MQSSFEQFLVAERANSSAKHAGISFISELGQASLTAGLIWTIAPRTGIFAWLAISALISLIVFWFHTRSAPHKATYNPNNWSQLSPLCSFGVGGIWALAPALFFVPENTLFIVLMLALYTGYVSGALAVTFAHQPSFLGFTIGATLPLFVRFLYEGGFLFNALSGLLIFYAAMLGYVSRNMDSLFIKSTRTQYDNTLLIDELAKEKEFVERAVQAKDKFLAAASHDLRQPLNAISLFTDALRPLQTTPAGNDIVEKIGQSLSGLNGMLHGLLDISRLDAEVVDNNPNHIPLNELVSPLCDQYRHKSHSLDIVCEISPSITVFADPTLLYRVIHNVLDNAVKYTREGSVSLKATVDGERVQLTIADTGIGIPDDKLGSVFDEFQQLNNPERDRDKGLGLGLAIVKRLCDIAGINVELKSKLGHGTRVCLGMRRGIPQPKAKASHPQRFSVLEHKLVVVIDDEKDILDGMRYLLSGWGCKVLIAESLQQARQRLSQQSHVPDLIISDLRLRLEQTGDDAILFIREEYNSEIPALLITGDTAPDKVARLADGNYKVLHKPVDPDQLKETMADLFKTED